MKSSNPPGSGGFGNCVCPLLLDVTGVSVVYLPRVSTLHLPATLLSSDHDETGPCVSFQCQNNSSPNVSLEQLSPLLCLLSHPAT